jgi:hypothetical protein
MVDLVRGGCTRPVLVELVGPAGAGKTTMSETMLARDPGVRELDLWGLPKRFLLPSAVALIPTFLAGALSPNPLRPAEAFQMIRLGGLLRAVRSAIRDGHRVILVDEGPVFALSWFHVNSTRDDDWWTRWRDRVVADWGRELSGVLRVDARDEVLTDRIRNRPTPHPVKHLTDEEISEFEVRFRRAFDRVVPEFEAAGRVSVRTLRTDIADPEECIGVLRSTIEEIEDGR